MSPVKPENKPLYPSNWKEIVAQVRARSGDKCEVCGVKNHAVVRRGNYQNEEVFLNNDNDAFKTSDGSPIGKLRYADVGDLGNFVRVVLTTAHLDHNPQNNDMGNLCHLCQLHHLRHDHAHHMKNAKETRKKKTGQIEMEL